jgi:serine/threonine protein kinase
MSRMTLRQAVHVLIEACIGVAVAHDAKIIHSDIKPGNILCSDDFSVVKLADFGLAHAITASMSAVSGVRGTALYMAPELHEDAPLSVATDVFSFGMTTWQLLHSGVINPLGTNIVTISSKLARGQRPDFTRVDAPPALKDLVARCLAHDPTHRPASMWEVHRELKAIMQQLPDTSAPTNLAVLLSQPVLATHALPSGTIQLVEEAATSGFAAFVRARMRRQAAGVSVSRICRVVVDGSRTATYLNMFMREASCRSSNAMLRPANPPDAAFAAGLNTLKSVFERTCLGASPPCNIVFAWHGTPAQYVPTSLSVTTAVPFLILSP